MRAIMFSAPAWIPDALKSSSMRPGSASASQRLPSFLISATDVNGWKISTLSPCTPNTLPLMWPDDFKAKREESLARGEFDFFDPDNIAPLVAFLCSESSSHISGKVFGVQGDSVEIFQPWTSVAEVRGDGKRWDPAVLAGRIDELFGSSGIQAGPENMMARMRYQILGEH